MIIAINQGESDAEICVVLPQMSDLLKDFLSNLQSIVAETFKARSIQPEKVSSVDGFTEYSVFKESKESPTLDSSPSTIPISSPKKNSQ